MKIDFDTRTALAFIVGVTGLVEQEFVRVVIGMDPSPVLSTTFGGFVLGSIGVGAYRGRQSATRDSPEDPEDPK